MRKYNKSVRKNIKKHRYSRRGHRGGYWFYPSPGDDVHVFTKLKQKIFPSSTPSINEVDSTTITTESVPETPALAPMPEPPVPVEEPSMAEPPVPSSGSLEYEPLVQAEMIANDNDEKDKEMPQEGGRRRYRRKRTTKRRRRNNKRKRTNKRRR